MKKMLGLVGFLVLLISIPQFIPGKQKSPLPRQHQQSKIVRQSPVREQYISLTFDDGPNPVYTPKMLEVLKKHKASATFFLLGTNIKKYPGLVRRILDDGCEIGIHAYDHTPLTDLTKEQVQSQINKTYQLVDSIGGYKPVLFRPPFGFVNKKVLAAAREKRLKIVLWSRKADPKDFKNPGADKIAKRVMASAAAGTIVLLHDQGTDRTQTVEAVDKIITQLSSKGYRFVTVSTLLKDPRFQDSIRR